MLGDIGSSSIKNWGMYNLRVFHSWVPHNFQEQSATLESLLRIFLLPKGKKQNNMLEIKEPYLESLGNYIIVK
jgi:hypothetical protein